jgi:hypothetical protein
MTKSVLNFSVRLCRGDADLRDACAVRAQAYGHHLPQVRQQFAQPDAQDRHRATAIVLCHDKPSGAPTGTLRIQRNCQGPLQLEGSLILPRWLADQPKAELTRLAVTRGADPLTRLMLMKASYLYCLASQVRWMVIGARCDALIRIYRRLGFRDVLGPDDRVPLQHAGGLPHRILAFDVTAAERTWLAAGHGLYPFMIETFHPDLRLFPEAPAMHDELQEDLAAA